MKEYDARDYLYKADEHFYGALNLYSMYIQDNYPYHKYDPLSSIANNCELSGELYIKAYMIEHGIDFENTHVLEKHLEKCIAHKNSFEELKKDISLLVNYTSMVNYPNEINMSKIVIDKTIKSVKRIMLFEEIIKIREKYNLEMPLLDDTSQDKNGKE
jgi:HEPN domain-containing protein